MPNVRVLVILDASEASRRAAEYVARVVRGRRGFHVSLAHVLPPLPPRLLEFGGAENPEEEERQEARLKAEQRRWIAAEKRKA